MNSGQARRKAQGKEDLENRQGHQRWRAQTGITFQVITSGISLTVATKENFF
jgi:hypothetical protein